MKLLIMSDLHLDKNSMYSGRNLLPELIDKVKSKAPDLILIAGDISNFASDSLKIIRFIENQVGVKVLFVPGNHDVWVDINESSTDAYNLFKEDSSSLIGRPYHLNDDYAVVGDMGWYDYSLAPITIPTYTMKSRKKSLWMDAKYVRFGESDEDIYQRIHQSLQAQLEKVQNKKVIFMNHFVPYQDFVKNKPNDAEWNLCNGFMGSSNLGDLLDSFPNVEYVIFGHTHQRIDPLIFRGKNIICRPLGYKGEWKTDDFGIELENSFTILEV